MRRLQDAEKTAKEGLAIEPNNTEANSQMQALLEQLTELRMREYKKQGRCLQQGRNKLLCCVYTAVLDVARPG